MNHTDTQEPTPDQTITVSQLPGALDACGGAKVLSLDCFDTILWRRLDRPEDVFLALQQTSPWQDIGLDAAIRIKYEARARAHAPLHGKSTEITLADIYALICRQLISGPLDPDRVATLVEQELQEEKQVCRALPQAVSLLEEADHRHIPVIIVSDMYMRQAQVRTLLKAALPATAFSAIKSIVVSSECGLSKSQGLLGLIARQLGVPAHDFLHIGDNVDADFHSARQAGYRALWLQRLPRELDRCRDYERAALRIFMDGTAARRPICSGYTTATATLTQPAANIAREIGHGTLGPMMHAFASWVLDQYHSHPGNQKPKIAFLMRDGHLLHKACEALTGQPFGHPVYISRITAYRASYRSTEDIERRLLPYAMARAAGQIIQHLPLDATRSRAFADQAVALGNDALGLLKWILEPAQAALIIDSSKAFSVRLRRHLENTLHLAPGDTLALVDLGYHGSVQQALAPIAQNEWQVTLLGWYFFSMPAPSLRNTYLGFLDVRSIDGNSLNALQRYVALLETLCAVSGGSAIDYSPAGEPLLKARHLPESQITRVRTIQQHVIDFVRAAARLHATADFSLSAEDMRNEALAKFARMVFFPTPRELEHYADFALELNLGSDKVEPLSNREQAIVDLRENGLSYVESAQFKDRLDIPHELRYVGCDQSLALLSIYKYGFPARRDEWSLRKLTLTITISMGQETLPLPVAAYPTYDGFYRLRASIGTGNMAVSVTLGDCFQWLQLQSCKVGPVETGDPHRLRDHPLDVRPALQMTDLREHEGGLLQCLSKQAALTLPANAVLNAQDRLQLDIVFRPIVETPPG